MSKKKKNIEITASSKGRFLQININGISHLCILLDEINGFQSWIDSNDWYCIEFYMKSGNDILCEYKNIEIWKAILKLSEEHIDG